MRGFQNFFRWSRVEATASSWGAVREYVAIWFARPGGIRSLEPPRGHPPLQAAGYYYRRSRMPLKWSSEKSVSVSLFCPLRR